MKGLIFYQNNLKRLCLLGFLFVFFILLLSLTLFPRTVRADTHTAASCSYAAVSAAVAAASSGDTVSVPACGSTTWDNTLTITKGITLQGAGIDFTTIKSNLNDITKDLIDYVPADPSLNEAFRITGFTLDGDWKSNILRIWNHDWIAYILTKIRVDHIKFVNANRHAFKTAGTIYGVMNNCQFIDCQQGIEFNGNDSMSWDNSPVALGTSHYFYVEDSTFDYTTVCTSGSHTCSGGIFQSGQGTQFVFRHNTITNHPDYVSQTLDIHGNNGWPVVAEYHDTGIRGAINVEIYSNSFNSLRASSIEFLDHRGGTLLMFDDTYTTAGTNNCWTALTEEDAYSSGWIITPDVILHGGTYYKAKQDHTASALDEPGVGANWTSYWATTVLTHSPQTWAIGRSYLFSHGYDTIKDSYYYNNTCNGNAIIPELKVPATDGLYIAENVQYFNLDPRGRTINGSVYQPYTYPHPLRSEITPSFKKGDLNEDGRVDIIDLGILLLNWGSTSRPAADINQDGRVDVIDFGILLSNWG
jgi:hypothetical protein